jgi:hypothetical protein
MQTLPLPWELTRSEAGELLTRIHDDATAWAKTHAATLPTETIDIDTQYRLERGKLDKLNRQWEQSGMPSERLTRERERQAGKVRELKARAEQNAANKRQNRHALAMLEASYLIANYPTIYTARPDYPFVVGTPLQGQYLAGWHKDSVRAALRQGLPVPDCVLADYPDLAK